MLVYRLCSKEEKKNILNNKSIKNIGKRCITNSTVNTFIYKKDRKYLHFFKDKENILYLNTGKNNFICTYDIPVDIVLKNQGIGYYYDLINFQKLINVEEFAIDEELLTFDNIVKIEEINNSIDLGDIIALNNFPNLDIVYENDQHIKKLSYLKKNKAIKLLYSILMSDDVYSSIKNNESILFQMMPELEDMVGFEHKHHHHHLDVYEHTLYALSLSCKDFDVRLSLLLHDIGKVFSYTEKNGVRHFKSHADISSIIARKILYQLYFSKQYVDKICYLIKLHDTPITQKDVISNFELTSLRFSIQKADALAHHPLKLEKLKAYLDKIKKLLLEK